MPYIEEIFSVGKVQNGYVLMVRVPYEILEKEAGGKDTEPVPVKDHERSFFAKNEKELSRLIAKLVPKIGAATTKAQYDAAFKEATGV